MNKVMTARFPGKCVACGSHFPAGTSILYSTANKTTAHTTCPPKPVAAPPAPQVNVANIVSFISAATKLKFPKLRVLNVNGDGELTLSVGSAKSKYPGTLFVRDSFLGRVGGVNAKGEAFGGVANDPSLRTLLTVVNSAPLAAAKHYAALKCSCSFCGLTLTDEASVEVGYGPVCAKHYGLPHKAKGAVELVPVLEVEPEQPELSPVDELLAEDEGEQRHSHFVLFNL